MFNPAINPPDFMKSVYGPEPRISRAAGLPGMVSLGVRELFPEMAPEIYLHDGDPAVIRKATEETLKNVNMDKIRPDHTVNLLCSEHGFAILGGWPYVEMLKTIKDVVEARTGCRVRLRAAMYRGFREAKEVVEHYNLEKDFGKVVGTGPWDKGVPVETEIGTLYCIEKLFDADWFIHAYYDDLREVYFHRLINRSLKAFAMSYSRLETRSSFHFNFMARGANILARLIFDSPFMQQRHAFSCLLRTSPAGIVAIDADNDLYAIDRRVTINHIKTYGKMLRLFAALDEFIAVIDGGRFTFYLQCGGICFGAAMNLRYDALDLDSLPSLSFYDKSLKGEIPKYIMEVNPAIKAVVNNQSWPGIACQDIPMCTPTIMVGRDQAERFAADEANPLWMDYAVTAETLEAAMGFAYRIAGTDKVLVFDGSHGYITCSRSMAEQLIKLAPEIRRVVETEYIPKWMKQRGLEASM